jgi:hypothetical protein
VERGARRASRRPAVCLASNLRLAGEGRKANFDAMSGGR